MPVKKIKLSKELDQALQNIADAVGCTVEETIEVLLTGCAARKAAWGDALNVPEPGMEFNRSPDGERMKGQTLYGAVYHQVRSFINTLILGERTLIALVDLCKRAGILQQLNGDDLKQAAAIYANKADKASRAYVN